MGDSAKLIILIWESPEKSWPRFVFDHFSSHWSTLQYDSTNVCTVRTKGMLNNIKNLRRKKMSLPHRKRFKTNYGFDNCRTFNFVLIYWELLSEQKELGKQQ